jgi:MFS family permease
VVPQFHAAFSVGAVAGSGLGALAAWGHLPLHVQFVAVGVASLAWRLRAIPDAVLPEEPRTAPVRRGGSLRESLVAWREPRTLVLGVVVMAGALSEGTANTWLAIGVVDGLHAREAVGALVFGAFVGSMTVARIGGTRLIDRYGRAAVLAASLTLAVAGLAGYALAPGLASAVLGAVAWGLGTGLVIPIGMASVTGHGPGAAGRVAVVSAFASTANLAAPPAIGVLAEAVGVRHAVLSVVAVMIVGMLLGRRVVEPAEAAQPVPAVPVAPIGAACQGSEAVAS